MNARYYRCIICDANKKHSNWPSISNKATQRETDLSMRNAEITERIKPENYERQLSRRHRAHREVFILVHLKRFWFLCDLRASVRKLLRLCSHGLISIYCLMFFITPLLTSSSVLTPRPILPFAYTKTGVEVIPSSCPIFFNSAA